MLRIICFLLIPLHALIICSDVQSQTIWTGPNITFSKAPLADPTEAANQDRITGNVWITRGSSEGIYNAATEVSYSRNSSPAGTQWAFPNNNSLVPLAELTANNWAALTFEDWETAFGGAGAIGPGGRGPRSTLGQPAVLHLISDNIYLNIKFIDPWGGAGDGSFSYERSTAVPEPACLSLLSLVIALATMVGSRRRRC